MNQDFQSKNEITLASPGVRPIAITSETSLLRSQNAALTARVEQLNKELEALQFGRCDDC